MKALGLAAAILVISAGTVMAQSSNNPGGRSNNSASQYAHGQKQKDPGDAKKYAPEQSRRNPVKRRIMHLVPCGALARY